MTPAEKKKLDLKLYEWNGKRSVHIIIGGFLWVFASPFLHEWAGVEFAKIDFYFAQYGPGGAAVVIGSILYIVRTVSARWDGHIKK